MYQGWAFADSLCGPEALDGAEFLILGIPFDATSSTRPGTRGGPDAIRQASSSFESFEPRYGVDLASVKIFDMGNLEVGSDLVWAYSSIKSAISGIPPGPVPIVLGGEHSITPPVVEVLAARDDLGVIVLDAHLDLREEYGFTGFSHACASRRILDLPIKGYSAIGIRSGSEEEFQYAEDAGINYHTSDEVFDRGIDRVLDDCIAEVSCERIYLSIDFDVFDPGVAPAVGCPEPFGLTGRDVRRIVERVAPVSVGLDLNEIAPIYDSGGTAFLGAKLAREFMAARVTAARVRASY